MKQSTGDTKRARAGAELRPDRTGVDELLEIVARFRRAVDASTRGAQARPRVRYADRAAEDGDATPSSSRPTTGVWGR